MLIYRNAEGVHGQRNLITPVLNLNPVPSPRGIFGGLSPPNKVSSPPIETFMAMDLPKPR